LDKKDYNLLTEQKEKEAAENSNNLKRWGATIGLTGAGLLALYSGRNYIPRILATAGMAYFYFNEVEKHSTRLSSDKPTTEEEIFTNHTADHTADPAHKRCPGNSCPRRNCRKLWI
jgi:hypothetical protein